MVSDHAGGKAPRSDEAWKRFGAALALLADLPWREAGLTVHDHDDFAAAHRARICDLGNAMSERLSGLGRWERLIAGPVPAPAPLVLTHGDPGPGNFLGDGARGTLID